MVKAKRKCTAILNWQGWHELQSEFSGTPFDPINNNSPLRPENARVFSYQVRVDLVWKTIKEPIVPVGYPL